MLSLSFVATEAVTDTVSRALKLFSKAVICFVGRALNTLILAWNCCSYQCRSSCIVTKMASC